MIGCTSESLESSLDEEILTEFQLKSESGKSDSSKTNSSCGEAEWFFSELLNFYVAVDVDGVQYPPLPPGSIGYNETFIQIAAIGFSEATPANYSTAEFLFAVPQNRLSYIKAIRLFYKYTDDDNIVTDGDLYLTDDTSGFSIMDGFTSPVTFPTDMFETDGCLDLRILVYFSDNKMLGIDSKNLRIDLDASYHYKLMRDLDI